MKNNMPLVSIVIPMHNAEKYVMRCINSIKTQTMQDFECIVIDDGSTDNSAKVLNNACSNDKRFKIISQQNSGAAIARNIGIDNAYGQWLTFCDIDDWMQPNRLEVAYDAAIQNNAQIIWNGMNIWQNGKLISKWHNDIAGTYLANQHIILSSKKYDIGHTPNKLYKMSLIKENCIRFPNIKMSEDLIFNIEAYFKAGSILNINDCLYNYERHSDSISMASKDKQNFIEVYSEFLKLQNKMKNNIIFKKNILIIDNFIKSIFLK